MLDWMREAEKYQHYIHPTFKEGDVVTLLFDIGFLKKGVLYPITKVYETEDGRSIPWVYGMNYTQSVDIRLPSGKISSSHVACIFKYYAPTLEDALENPKLISEFLLAT